MVNREAPLSRTLADRWLNKSGRYFMPVCLLLVTGSIAWGWSVRDQNYLTAENGLGYWLGIIGGSMMLLLLTYSLRKRLSFLKRVLKLKLWFQFHMTLGIVGPLFILFHSNFQRGSLNSTVALVCMLLVAGSGVIGRYLYSKIHFGLYGERIRLQQVHKDFLLLKSDMLDLVETDEQSKEVENLFVTLESLIQTHTNNSGDVSVRESRQSAEKVSTLLGNIVSQLESYHREKTGAHQAVDVVSDRLSTYSSILQVALRRLPGLQRSERLFSLWHVIHLPVFGLMIITAITHVVAVHMY
ncbi:MAG: transcriptional regulator [Gammaproteobacteria bacterium]|nr:transcriptional regulator [Gammaproteobacteria bacterium]